jgi:murein DD-endopeptidase MepM/ murein hydrolase activator NlpD
MDFSKRARRRLTRAGAAVLIAAFMVALPNGPAAAGQPSVDDQIAAADAALKKAQLKLGKAYKKFTTAENRHKRAVAAVKSARAKEKRARGEKDAAVKLEQGNRGRFDQFTSASYVGGSTVNSEIAVVGSNSPDAMLQRAAMLDVLGDEYSQVMGTLTRAAAQKAKAEKDARAALADASRNRDVAAKAKTDAKRAYDAALAQQDEAKSEADRLANRKAGLIAQSGSGGGGVVLPAQGSFTSGFGPRGGTIHEGVDIANSIGTPILAAMPGEVIEAGPASGFGQWVRIQHDGGTVTVYGHVATFAVSAGQNVAAGDQIATMGNEGQSTGPHLHFEVHQDGTPIDPQAWLSGFGINL